jgi:nicotinamidase-related amidase
MAKTALLIIDMQNRWISAGKTLFPAAETVISTINQLRSAWIEQNQPVIFVTMVHEADGSTLSKFDSSVWIVRGSDEAKIVPELTPVTSERVIEKIRYSAFFNTGLAELMKQESIENCVITGYQARACIMATTLDAYQNEIRPVVVRDGILETDKEYLDFYLKVFAEADLLKSAREAIAALSGNG